MNIDPPIEEYRYLHSTMQLKLSLWDKTKVLLGQKVYLGACFRLCIKKNPDESLENVDVDMFSAKAVVVEGEDVVPTSDAVFNYEQLHNTGDK